MQKTGNNKATALTLILLTVLPILHFLLCIIQPAIFHISPKNLITLYIFIGGFTLIHLIVMRPLLKKWPRQAGLLVTAMSFFKMLLSLLILILLIFPLAGKNISTALNFIFIYFFFLTIESIIIIRFLIPTIKK